MTAASPTHRAQGCRARRNQADEARTSPSTPKGITDVSTTCWACPFVSPPASMSRSITWHGLTHVSAA
jgi:hypothetical protein